jgi:hypothetical protein
MTVDKSVGKLLGFPAFAGVRSLMTRDCLKSGTLQFGSLYAWGEKKDAGE